MKRMYSIGFDKCAALCRRTVQRSRNCSEFHAACARSLKSEFTGWALRCHWGGRSLFGTCNAHKSLAPLQPSDRSQHVPGSAMAWGEGRAGSAFGRSGAPARVRGVRPGPARATTPPPPPGARPRRRRHPAHIKVLAYSSSCVATVPQPSWNPMSSCIFRASAER